MVAHYLLGARREATQNSQAWLDFQNEISNLALPASLKRGISLWTLENLERHRPELVRHRILHDVEQRFISSEAHGRLLEAQHLGMLSPAQVEAILEDLANREMAPIDPEHMQNLLVKTWSRNVSGIRNIKVN